MIVGVIITTKKFQIELSKPWDKLKSQEFGQLTQLLDTPTAVPLART
jgi:hypothetical protein